MLKIVTIIAIIFCLPLDTAISFSGNGSGTETDPYQITNVHQLQEMNDNLSAHYILMNDIDASVTRNWNIGDHDGDPETPDSAMGFVPVGNFEEENSFAGFTGSLDGQGHSISNIFINRPIEDDVGFFGYIDFKGEVKNAHLTNSYVNGNNVVGGFCAMADHATFNRCSYSGYVFGNYAGGFCGHISKTVISNCFSDVFVDGYEYIAGFCCQNYNNSLIEFCYSIFRQDFQYLGIGGFCFQNGDSCISNCYVELAGYTGYWGDPFCNHNGGYISYSYCYSDECIIYNYNKTYYIDDFKDMINKETFNNWDFRNIWFLDENKSPQLRWTKSSFSGNGKGTEGNPYIITNIDELQQIIYDPTAHYEIVNNIDASSTSDWTTDRGFFPINGFSGYLDGNNYIVDGLILNRPKLDYLSPFGIIYGASIKDVTLKNVYISGSNYLGGFFSRSISDFSGSIENCDVSGEIFGKDYIGGFCGINENSIFNSSSSCRIFGMDYIGGFCSINESIVKRSKANTFISANGYIGGFSAINKNLIEMSKVKCELYGYYDVGGFCSKNEDKILNSYVDGELTGYEYAWITGFCSENDVKTDFGSIENCYSSVKLSSKNMAFGICSENLASDILNCYWDTQTSGIAESDGGEGKTTTEMMMQSTFENWDFYDIWCIVEGQTYPHLQCFVDCDTLVSVPTIESNERLEIYPNPATSHITLSLGEEFISAPEIDIIDYLGNVIRWTPFGRWSPSDKSITINTSSLSPGVYFLRLRCGEKLEVRKFVVI
jgi:hypothetical protein